MKDKNITTFIPASDTHIFKYCGMWQATDVESPDTMVSYWNDAYVEINFTGNSITPVFSRESSFKIKMDKAEEYSAVYNVKGEITLIAEGEGDHTLRIYGNNRNAHIHFAGVIIPEDEKVSRTPDRPHYIHFIGDSISDNPVSFSHRAGDILGWDFTVTALSGIALERNYGYWNIGYGGDAASLIKQNFGVNNIGMEDAFFKLGIPMQKPEISKEEFDYYTSRYYTDELDYNFNTGYTPDIVFIFLGTNDELTSDSDADRFTKAYLSFVERILEIYGNDTKVCILQALSHSSLPNDENHPRYTVIRTAARAIKQKYPQNITFIDRDIVKGWNVEISSDTTHPSENGYNTLTKCISEFLGELFK